jgi:hypothetical protein
MSLRMMPLRMLPKPTGRHAPDAAVPDAAVAARSRVPRTGSALMPVVLAKSVVCGGSSVVRQKQGGWWKTRISGITASWVVALARERLAARRPARGRQCHAQPKRIDGAVDWYAWTRSAGRSTSRPPHLFPTCAWGAVGERSAPAPVDRALRRGRLARCVPHRVAALERAAGHAVLLWVRRRHDRCRSGS